MRRTVPPAYSSSGNSRIMGRLSWVPSTKMVVYFCLPIFRRSFSSAGLPSHTKPKSPHTSRVSPFSAAGAPCPKAVPDHRADHLLHKSKLHPSRGIVKIFTRLLIPGQVCYNDIVLTVFPCPGRSRWKSRRRCHMPVQRSLYHCFPLWGETVRCSYYTMKRQRNGIIGH